MTKSLASKRHVDGIVAAGPASFSRVRAAFARGPIKVQRDHETRAPKASYIGKTLRQDQCIFHLVMWEGVERLVDGYTRVERVIRDLTDEPKGVLVVIYEEPASEKALTDLYDQFNSTAALKKSGDRYSEGLRSVGKLHTHNSHLVVHGQKSAAQYATGARNIREGVERAIDGMDIVDSYGLHKNGEVLGTLGAYYAIAQEGVGDYAQEAKDFICKLNAPFFEPTLPTARDTAIMNYRKFVSKKKAGGTATAKTGNTGLFTACLYAFVEYAGLTAFAPSGTTLLSLAEFKEVMSSARKVR